MTILYYARLSRDSPGFRMIFFFLMRNTTVHGTRKSPLCKWSGVATSLIADHGQNPQWAQRA